MTIAVSQADLAADGGERVVDLLEEYGEAVECSTVSRVDLDGRNVLWMVTAGAMDLFAVDAGQHGRWHYLGRLDGGTIVDVSIKCPRHTLLGRSWRGCLV